MDRVTSAIIDFAEAAYDLEASESEWLPKVLEAGLPVFDHGRVVAGAVYARPPQGGPVVPERCHVVAGPKDFAGAYTRAVRELPVDVIRSLLAPQDDIQEPFPRLDATSIMGRTDCKSRPWIRTDSAFTSLPHFQR